MILSRAYDLKLGLVSSALAQKLWVRACGILYWAEPDLGQIKLGELKFAPEQFFIEPRLGYIYIYDVEIWLIEFN